MQQRKENKTKYFVFTDAQLQAIGEKIDTPNPTGPRHSDSVGVIRMIESMAMDLDTMMQDVID